MDWTPRPLPLLLAASALLAACQGARPAEPAAAAPVAGPVVFQSGPAPNAPAAVVSGRLQVDQHGCVRLGDRALVWPAQAALDISQPGVVRIYNRQDGVSVRVGEPVALLVGAAEPDGSSRCGGRRLAVSRFMPVQG